MQRPCERVVTVVPGATSTAASASNAAIFGVAKAPSSDQPARSRMLTKEAAGPAAPSVSAKSGASWVQPISSSSPPAAAA